MTGKTIILALIALTLPGLSGNARAALIEFGPSTADPNDTGSANTNAFGSDSVVSVGYSAYTYNYPSGYGGLNSGTGAGVYSDNDSSTLVMTFTATAGSTVTLNSFNLAQYADSSDAVDISVTGGGSPFTVTDTTPAGGTGNFTTYSPDETGTSLTLTVTNLYDVGINEISFSESTAAPEPASLTLLGVGIAGLIGSRLRRREPPAA